MLSKDAAYVKKGHEAAVADASKFPFENYSLDSKNQPILTRWDGMRGTGPELLADILAMARVAVSSQKDFIPVGFSHGVKSEVSPLRTAKGNGNKFFRLSGVVEIPPALYVAGLLHPTEIGNCDATLRLNRVLHDFEDGKTRLYHLIVEIGSRPLLSDRDDCTLTSYHVDEDGTWWQFSTSTPSHVRSFNSQTVRLWTMYWAYKLEPIKAANGETHCRFTLITQTEIHGWMPKFLVNQMVPEVLTDYVRHLEKRLREKYVRRLPAVLLTESFGLSL